LPLCPQLANIMAAAISVITLFFILLFVMLLIIELF